MRLWVGKSNTRVSGRSGSSRRSIRRFRNSTAASESSPASISGASTEVPGNSSAMTSCTTSCTTALASSTSLARNVAGKPLPELALRLASSWVSTALPGSASTVANVWP